MQKNLHWKSFRTAFGHYDFRSTSASQQAWRMRKRYHLLLTTTLIWRPLCKVTLNFYSLLLSQSPFSSSFESLFHQTNIRDSAVVRAQSFSVAQKVPKWRQSVGESDPFSHGTVCTSKFKLRICSCLACVYRVMDARGKFGEHERCVRVARGAAESNSSFLSALQTSQVHP